MIFHATSVKGEINACQSAFSFSREPQVSASLRLAAKQGDDTRKCLKNYVSCLNSGAAMVDEINNFPAEMVFSRKSPWPEERLILNLLRLASARAQRKPAHSACGRRLITCCCTHCGNRGQAIEMACYASYSKNVEKKSMRETFFVLVGLAFCALRVSIRVDVKCGGQLTPSEG
jgi:hypothetical protein